MLIWKELRVFYTMRKERLGMYFETTVSDPPNTFAMQEKCLVS